MCAEKLTIWPTYSSVRYRNKKIKEKLKTNTDYLRWNGAGKSPWRQWQCLYLTLFLRYYRFYSAFNCLWPRCPWVSLHQLCMFCMCRKVTWSLALGAMLLLPLHLARQQQPLVVQWNENPQLRKTSQHHQTSSLHWHVSVCCCISHLAVLNDTFVSLSYDSDGDWIDHTLIKFYSFWLFSYIEV